MSDKIIDSRFGDGIECGYVAWSESSEGRVLESMLIALANVLGRSWEMCGRTVTVSTVLRP